MSLLSVTDTVKWLLFAFLIRDFVKFLYFLCSAQFRSFFLFISLYLRACAMSGLYHGGISLGFNTLRFNRRMLVETI